MAGTKKQIPKFRSEDDERKFWATNDSSEFIDWQSGQKRKFPKLKPSLRTISLRLPVSMIEDLKILANKRDVPYQSLLKVFLAERLEKERRPRAEMNMLRYAERRSHAKNVGDCFGADCVRRIGCRGG
jgi:predicted DNA binding CopG/RHH family protein